MAVQETGELGIVYWGMFVVFGAATLISTAIGIFWYLSRDFASKKDDDVATSRTKAREVERRCLVALATVACGLMTIMYGAMVLKQGTVVRDGDGRPANWGRFGFEAAAIFCLGFIIAGFYWFSEVLMVRGFFAGLLVCANLCLCVGVRSSVFERRLFWFLLALSLYVISLVWWVFTAPHRLLRRRSGQWRIDWVGWLLLLVFAAAVALDLIFWKLGYNDMRVFSQRFITEIGFAVSDVIKYLVLPVAFYAFMHPQKSAVEVMRRACGDGEDAALVTSPKGRIVV